MARARRHAPSRPGTRKVAKTFRLAPAKIAAAQRVLGTTNATETIERALDMVVFRDELVQGTRRLLGAKIERSRRT